MRLTTKLLAELSTALEKVNALDLDVRQLQLGEHKVFLRPRTSTDDGSGKMVVVGISMERGLGE